MNARLLPWAAMALLVLLLAGRSAVTGDYVAAKAVATVPEAAGGGAEIRLGPVDVRELHDDGSWNRLDAAGAVYGYANRTVSASEVTVHPGEGSPFAGTTVRASLAEWDLDGKKIVLPRGCRVERKGGWTGELSAATLDLAGSVLRDPGPARIEGPGVSVRGENLAWEWAKGRITMESTTSRITPGKAPGGRE